MFFNIREISITALLINGNYCKLLLTNEDACGTIISQGGDNMRTKGNVRAIDELGRIVLPIEFRTALDIKSGDLLKMDMDGEKIVIQKNTPSCVFCGTEIALTKYEGKTICIDCIRKISKIPN